MSDATKTTSPSLGNGKICYIGIPAIDCERSAVFYERIFGWEIRRRPNGTISFNDGVGQVSGKWIPNRPPSSDSGLLMYIMVDSAAETLELIMANGGRLVQPIDPDAPETTALFADPGGNVIGLYEEAKGEK